MKLYIYDHCPYCMRAKMIFGLKNLALEEQILLNDDEQTPVQLVGKKVVPILIKENGEAMPESLDIVKYIDKNYGEKLLDEQVRPEIEEWIKEVTSYYNFLLMPRFIQLSVAEFATPSALDYFVQKKTAYVGDFNEHLANSAQYIARLEQDFAKLLPLIETESAKGHLSLEDILLFPILRNLTCVKGLTYPAKLAEYVANMSKKSKIALYSEYAV